MITTRRTKQKSPPAEKVTGTQSIQRAIDILRESHHALMMLKGAPTIACSSTTALRRGGVYLPSPLMMFSNCRSHPKAD
jgi:hypothetical protein